MLALLKLIQSIIKTLHSADTPGQVAAGMALGSVQLNAELRRLTGGLGPGIELPKIKL